MSFLVVLFILYAIFGNRKNKFSFKQWSTIKKLIIGFIVCSVLFDGVFSLFPFVFMLAPFWVPALFIAKVVKASKKQKEEESRRMTDYYQGSNNQRDDQSGRYYGYAEMANQGKQIKTKGNILPKAASKRRSIIQKFNKQYELYLTDSQIQRMVDASYYSPEWEKEVAAMAQEYNSIYEWYQGDTGWLRAYLKAFKVQSISSDFKQQEQICFAEFNQVFGGVQMEAGVSYDRSIAQMNEKFFTGFDDLSFMIAYRFLESHGKKYSLGNDRVISADQELEDLAKKYTTRPSH